MLYKHSPSLLSWSVWLLTALFYCYEYLLRILPSVMTEHLRNLFMMNGLGFGNLAAAYYYTYVPMQIPAGILMDRSTPQKVLAAACFICAIGTYSFSSHNFYIAYTGRCLVGLGSAFAFVGVMKLATLWFPSNYFTFVTGLTTSLGMLGAMLGNFSLVHLINWLGIDLLLKSAVFVGCLLTVSIYFVIPKHNPIQVSQPIKSINATNYRLEIFALLKDFQIWALGIIGCCLFLSLTSFSEMWGIPYLVENYQLSKTQAANYNALVFLGWAIGSPLMGYVASQCHVNYLPRLLRTNALLSAFCFSLVLYCPQLVTNYLSILLFLFGLFSSVQVIVFTLVRNLYRASVSGIAFAVTNLIVMLGGGLSQPIVGYLLDQSSSISKVDGLIHFSSQGFIYALSFIPVSFLLAIILTYCITSDPQSSAAQ